MKKNNGLLEFRKLLFSILMSGTMTAEALTGAVPVYAQPAATQSETGKEEDSKKVLDQATIKRIVIEMNKKLL